MNQANAIHHTEIAVWNAEKAKLVSVIAKMVKRGVETPQDKQDFERAKEDLVEHFLTKPE